MRAALRIGIVDTGINPWHSHVRGRSSGRRLFVRDDGSIGEDGDFRDVVGHGTAVAGVIREIVPEAHLFAVRVFDAASSTYPSLVARAILLAAAQRCTYINLSIAVPPGPGAAALEQACKAALEADCVLFASCSPGRETWLPAAIDGVHGVSADDRLALDVVEMRAPLRFAAAGRPRELATLPPHGNLWGDSFACARALARFAREPRCAQRASGSAPVSSMMRR